MKTVGIVGFGSFGKFLAEQLDANCKVLVYSYSIKPNKWQADLKDVAEADYLLLAVPIDSYHSVLKDLKPLLSKETILVDVCSVKQKSVEIIRGILPDQQLAVTHPLFGPQSADELAGHTLVLCPEDSSPRVLQEIEDFAKQLHLHVIHMTAKEHDKEMATVQGLTFFIAHVLKEMKLHRQKLNTPSFKRLIHLAELEAEHSDELFYTIQSGNPQTQTIRQQFIDYAVNLNEKVNSKKLP